MCGSINYKTTIDKPRRRNKRVANLTSTLEEVVFSAREKFRCKTFNVILDKLFVTLLKQGGLFISARQVQSYSEVM